MYVETGRLERQFPGDIREMNVRKMMGYRLTDLIGQKRKMRIFYSFIACPPLNFKTAVSLFNKQYAF